MYKHDYDKKLFRLIDILGKLYREENLLTSVKALQIRTINSKESLVLAL